MKKVLFFIAFNMVMISYAQNNLTKAQWQEDLKFLQETVHKDYPFLFKKTTAEIFDSEVVKLHKDIPNLQQHEIIVGFARIVSLFKYGHTDISFSKDPFAFSQLPINLYHFNDGVFIQGTHKTHENTLGAKVLAIEGKPIKTALELIHPTVPSENSQFFKAYGLNYLRIPEVLHAQGITSSLKTSVEFTLEKNGKTFTHVFSVLPDNQRIPVSYSLTKQDDVWLDARNQDKTPNYLKHLDKIYYYEYLPEQKAVYVRHSQIQDDSTEAIPEFYERVFNFIDTNDVEKLIIDVRLNGGGNNYKNKPIITNIIKSKKINRVGNLFVITGRRTFSACQNLVNEMSNYTNAIFVGEPTGENINFYGDNRTVELPNSKIPVFLSFAWWQDKPQWENAEWLAPHIAVDMSFEEYKTNKDPVLQAALDFTDNNFVLNPMQYLTSFFMKGEVDKLKSEAARMVMDTRYKFFDFEGEFNKAGYNVLGSGQMQEAIFVFQMVTELFPNSANAWNSLAEAYLKAGDKTKALEYYNKALKTDPEGDTGKNAQEMIKEIKQ
ncbi:tetratricopeptide repeat protein [Pontimicrobium aquaticum]|uniref:Tetratricopeptide repeat protein n=1 Tax=Pontimicrobium aquaticum TaxID=2565367 RepID=A0A4U0EPF0_9FLAO|nr:tetratricopeptide repeat protein [Pontimicrobium aquaticum]TJY33358.1 tetratricopeptide repeat protein [Pontimicrobium aquaticum]